MSVRTLQAEGFNTVSQVVQKRNRDLAAPERRTYSVVEAARVLGVAPATIYREVAAGRMRHIRLGKRIVIPQWVVSNYLGQENARAGG
ncbi:MAG: helix-turn-helix domain-containing protein [Bacillota bacterium]|nr:helix-turn-helix domain-containing protein [Bacillota bacterium]